MKKIETAMIMAAGLGTRMQPLTNDRPKPLVEVAGKPMIDHCLAKLVEAGLSKAVVNVHYLPEMLEEHLSKSTYPLDIQISDERSQLMETGGGLILALPLIDDDPFYCINSDNLWSDGPDRSLHRLEEYWNDAKMDALLLIVPHASAYNFDGAGDFFCDGDGRVSRRGSADHAPYIYTGIQLISKRLLRDAPDGPFSTNILWSRAIEEGRLFGLVHEGDWFEVGNPQAIEPTEAALASA